MSDNPTPKPPRTALQSLRDRFLGDDPGKLAEYEQAKAEMAREDAEEIAVMDSQTVVIDYVNYRGERSTRRIIPASIRFGSTEHHPEPQWLLEAYDRDKGVERTFAMRDIHAWEAGLR